MDIFFLVAPGIGLLIALSETYGRGADDPGWELRWRASDRGYRDWLAAMTTSRTWLATLDDTDEIELANGFARRARRRRAYFDLVGFGLLIFAGALVLAGALPTSVSTLGLSIYVLSRALAEFLQNRQLKLRLDQRTDPDVAPTRQDTAAA